jgi:MFS superfamily sulfate permease-like transporter
MGLEAANIITGFIGGCAMFDQTMINIKTSSART